MTRPVVHIVGAGPGDPELITVKGRRLLREADAVLYTGSLVPREHLDGLRAEVADSKGMTLDAIVDWMVERARRGLAVVRLHTGDPGLFGAVREQVVRLEAAGIAVEIVPGVTAALAAAAALGVDLTVPERTQTVVLSRTEGRTPMPERERLEALAALGCTLCLYLSATLADKVERDLLAGGLPPDTPAAVVQYASMPRQRIVRCTLAGLGSAVREAGIRAQAMILVGPALDTDRPAAASRLYDPSFDHGFRQGRTPRPRPALQLTPGDEA